VFVVISILNEEGGDNEDQLICRKIMESTNSYLTTLDKEAWSGALGNCQRRTFSVDYFLLDHIIEKTRLSSVKSLHRKLLDSAHYANRRCLTDEEVLRRIICKLLPSSSKKQSTRKKLSSDNGNGGMASDLEEEMASDDDGVEGASSSLKKRSGGDPDDPFLSEEEEDDEEVDDHKNYDDDDDDDLDSADHEKVDAFTYSEAQDKWVEDTDNAYRNSVTVFEEAFGQKCADVVGGPRALGPFVLRTKQIQMLEQPQPHFYVKDDLLYVGSPSFSDVCSVLEQKQMFPQFLSIIIGMPLPTMTLLCSLGMNLNGAMKDIIGILIMGPPCGKSQASKEIIKFKKGIQSYLGPAFKLVDDSSVKISYGDSEGSKDERNVFLYCHQANYNWRLLDKTPSDQADWLLPNGLDTALHQAYDDHSKFISSGQRPVPIAQGTQKTPRKSLASIIKLFCRKLGMRQDDIFMDIGGGELYATAVARVVTKAAVCASDTLEICRGVALIYKSRPGFTHTFGDDFDSDLSNMSEGKKKKRKNGGNRNSDEEGKKKGAAQGGGGGRKKNKKKKKK